MSLPMLLLFDLGGVLIKSAVFESLNNLLPEPLELTTIKQRWLFSPSVRSFERGEIQADEFAALFIAEWQLNITPQQFLTDFAIWPREFFPGARETLRELRGNYRIGCLSNSNELHWQRISGIEADFDISLFSHRLGAIKPDKDIFELALNECNIEPAAIYFFDDCAANVQSAQSFGITAFHVDGFESLQLVLRAQGLLVDSASQAGTALLTKDTTTITPDNSNLW